MWNDETCRRNQTELRNNALQSTHGLDTTMFDEAIFQKEHECLNQAITFNMSRQIADNDKQIRAFLDVHENTNVPSQVSTGPPKSVAAKH